MEVVDKSKFKFVGRDSRASEVIDTPTYSYWKSVARQFFQKSTYVMLAILSVILLMSFIYPMVVPYDFSDVSNINDFSKRYIWPNSEYWFGTDKMVIHYLMAYGMGHEIPSNFGDCNLY